MVLGPRGGRQLNTLAKLSAVGIEFAISTVLGLLGGRWIDEKLGTPPWLMLLGLVLGVTAGMRSLLRTAKQANQANQANQAEGSLGEVDKPADKSTPPAPDDPSKFP